MPWCPRFAADAGYPADKAGKGSVSMKSIFNLRPVLIAVLLVSSFFWTNGSFAQSASSNDSKPAVAQTAPSTTIPAGSQSLPAASQTPPAASQPVPAATQVAPTGDTQTCPSTATQAIANDQPAATSDAQQPAGTDTQQANQKDTFKHDGGKDDVDAIGNRKGVGGHGMGNWYSYEKEIAMGKENAQQIESSVKLIQDPVLTEHANPVRHNPLRNSHPQTPFPFNTSIYH